jgi:hypothetical protein
LLIERRAALHRLIELLFRERQHLYRRARDHLPN